MAIHLECVTVDRQMDGSLSLILYNDADESWTDVHFKDGLEKLFIEAVKETALAHAKGVYISKTIDVSRSLNNVQLAKSCA